jgi:hypothetical protein
VVRRVEIVEKDGIVLRAQSADPASVGKGADDLNFALMPEQRTQTISDQAALVHHRDAYRLVHR